MRWFALALVACTSSSSPAPADYEAAANARSGSTRCKETQACGSLVYVDCGAAVDGPAYYFDDSLEVVSTCGGACFVQPNDCATMCPPAAWTCD